MHDIASRASVGDQAQLATPLRSRRLAHCAVNPHAASIHKTGRSDPFDSNVKACTCNYKLYFWIEINIALLLRENRATVAAIYPTTHRHDGTRTRRLQLINIIYVPTTCTWPLETLWLLDRYLPSTRQAVGIRLIHRNHELFSTQTWRFYSTFWRCPLDGLGRSSRNARSEQAQTGLATGLGESWRIAPVGQVKRNTCNWIARQTYRRWHVTILSEMKSVLPRFVS